MGEITMSAVELREALGRRIDAAYYRGETTSITKNGERRAVLVPADQWDAMIRAARPPL